MTTNSSSSEPIPGGSEAVSGAVSEHVAARRLGVSLDVLRRDRRSGKLGIPFIKIGEGKRGLVRYDLADLERWVAERKRVGRALAAQVKPSVVEEAVEQPEPPVEMRAPQPDVLAPPAPCRPSPPRTPWERDRPGRARGRGAIPGRSGCSTSSGVGILGALMLSQDVLFRVVWVATGQLSQTRIWRRSPSGSPGPEVRRLKRILAKLEQGAEPPAEPSRGRPRR